MLKGVALSFCFASAFLRGECMRTNPVRQHHDPVLQYDLPQEVLTAGDGPIKAMEAAQPHYGAPIPQAKRNIWIVKCNSEQPNNECNKAVDGSLETFWQTKVDTSGTNNPDPLPHTITIDLRAVQNVNAVSMTPRSDAGTGGAVAGHKVYLSLDNQTWGDPVAFGTWFNDQEDKYAVFEPQKAQFVRLQATSASSATQFVRIVDIGIWAIDSFTPPVRGLGIWGPTIDFPLVPVGVFIDPISGKVVSFSSYAHDDFSQSNTDGTTLTSAWDRATGDRAPGTVSQRRVRHTGHDMFCPGMAFDVNGRMLISGGESAEKVSIYEPTSDDWKTVPPMNIARGYPGSTTCADGRIFIIGGSWGPEGQPRGHRTGEIYDPKTNAWNLLDGCPASPIETKEDWEKDYRADNHVWLMGWSNNSVFHAGPAKDMHWITTAGKGAIENAGRREDHDAMCGVAAMYDAGKGKILATGGAPQYKLKENGQVMGENATNHASIITLGQVNATVNVEPAGQGMNYQRIFHHAVILPNGETFVVGGQIEGTGFTEDSPQMVPEIYSPTRNTWTPMAAHSTVRVYHSFGLLLPDATVIVGGGGLCGNCDGRRVNHFDAQIYTPQYLLTSNGDRAKRPVIARTSAASVKHGASLTIITDNDVVGASLVRYGGATHSLNNDQRRIELKLQKSGTALQYSVSIPSDGGIAIPGYWMLFVLNAQGVPSEAKNVQILVS